MLSHRSARKPVMAVAGLAIAAISLNVGAVGAQGGTVTLGSYQSDDVPKAALQAGIDYCQEQTGLQVTVNTVNHNDFQEAISSYLQGTPDDVFTWFAGYRLRYFADQGLIGNIDDVWANAKANYSDAFTKSVTGNDGHIYMVPWGNYPWVVMYRKSLFADKGYTVPTTWADFTALADQMKTDGLIPMAFADKDGWPAQGTFDILNMRINGYDFHIALMAGNESWTDPKVTAVFEQWKQLIPYYSDGALGLTWQEGAQQLMNDPQKAGMYFLGTFATQQAVDPAIAADIDFFPFPTLGTAYDSELGIDAPIDGFALSAKATNPDGAKQLLACLATGAAQNKILAVDPSNVGAANDVDTSGYTDVQKKEAALIANSHAIAQFLDRDTVPAFAGPNGMQGLLQNFLSNPDQDLAAYQQSIQDAWDTLSVQ
jgi:multiple sugar transport system substrate-binding protein